MATGGSSSGQYKPEHEYFCRYFRLVNETGAKPLRKLLKKEASSRNMNVDAFLGTKRQTFRALVQSKIIRQGQYDLIYPTQTSFDIHSLDITLLCCIIKNVCNLSPKGRKAIKDLRDVRNEICHDSNPELPESIYNAKFSNVCNIIKLLLNEYGDKNFEAKIEHEMNTVNTDLISSSQTVELIKTFIDNQKEVNTEMVKDRIDQLEGKISKSTDDLTTEIKHIYAKVDKHPKENMDVLERLLNTHKEEYETTPKMHPSIEPLRKQTEVILNEVSDFVYTKQFHKVEEMLLSSGVVIITGGAGEGKTNTAIEIMRRHGDKMKCLQINCPNDVSLIDPRMIEFVFIDDIFGNNELDESKLKSWFPVLEKLQQLVNARELKLIIATREIVLKECNRLLRKFTLFTKTTSLSSGKLSPAEKLKILTKALQKRQRSCTQETMQQCVSAFKSDLGFPYMCILFSSDEQFFHEGHQFFKRNLVMNSGIISQLTPSKKMSLLFLWIKGNTFPVILNRSEENDKILKQLSAIVKYESDTNIDGMYDAIFTSLRVMDGVFVNVKADGYWFAHNSIYQSCGFYLAQKGLSEEIIKYSALAFFMEHITITESVYRPDCVFIRKNQYQNIVDRIISEVTENDHAREMAAHPCLSQDILKLLIETLEKRKQLKEFLLYDKSHRNEKKYKSFVANYLESCAPNSCWFLGQILGLKKCKRHFTQISKERECRTYQIQLHACRGACRGGNLDAFKLIQAIYFEGSVLVDIAASGNTDMYKYVKDRLKKPLANILQSEALNRCIQKGDINMYNTIRQSGFPVSTSCLRTAAKMKNAELVKHIIDDLGQSKALKVDVNVRYTFCTLFDTEVFETFLQNGVCPSKDDMRCSLKNNYNIVETILWDTKYAVEFQKKRPTSDLRIRLWSDLTNDELWRDQLCAMGILETPNFLEKVVASGNIGSAKEIVQRLTNNNDWNPATCFVTNLLNSALSTNTQMYELLLSCNAEANECTLYKAVLTGDLQLVKLTITKMKQQNNFDPKRKAVRRAFLQSIFNFSIYEYFVSQGLQPTAYHYRFTVECQAEQAETLKVLQHISNLTDNFASLNNDVMGTALLVSLGNDEIVRFLDGKNVKYPRNTLSLISFDGYLDTLEKAITYLKCQNEWPPCQSIFAESLYNTFYRPDLFELLMVENEREEMCMPISEYSILFAIRRKKFDLVENYVSHMQENDLWDSNDIVLKVALLESIDDIETSTLLKRHGVRSDDLLDEAYELGKTELESYIIAFLIKNGQQEINYKTLSKYIVNSLSNYRELCSEQLLERAVEVCGKKVVLEIANQLIDSNPSFPHSDVASNILNQSSKSDEIYCTLIDCGFTPSVACLLNVVKEGSLETFQKTIDMLKKEDMFPISADISRDILQESLKRRNVRFYTILSAHGLMPQFDDIGFAIESDNTNILKFLIADLKHGYESGREDILVKILELDENLYKRLQKNMVKLDSLYLCLIVDSFFKKKLVFQRVELAFTDFFSNNHWSFNDENLMNIYQRSKGNSSLHNLVLDKMENSLKESILETVYSRKSTELKMILSDYRIKINELFPDILRQICLFRKRICRECKDVIIERVEESDCSQRLKLLCSVMYLSSDDTLQRVYSLSQDDKKRLDKRIIQTALEEAVFLKKPGIYICILTECHIEPTTYCLLFCLYHNYDTCFSKTLDMLDFKRKTCDDPYYTATLALCCQRKELDIFRLLLKMDKYCDTEMFYEAIASCNGIIIDQVKEVLMTNGQWDLGDYWISSSLFENPNMKHWFETDYEVPTDVLMDTENDYLTPLHVFRENANYSKNTRLIYERESRNTDDVEPEYEDLEDYFSSDNLDFDPYTFE